MAFKTELENPELLVHLGADERKKAYKLVDNLVAAAEEVSEATKKANKLKDELRQLAKPLYWGVNFQANAPLHTFDASGRSSKVQLNFLNRYFILDSGSNENKVTADEKYDEIVKLLGEDHVLMDHIQKKEFVHLEFSGLSADQVKEFTTELIALRDKYGVTAVCTSAYEVDKEFHDARHDALPEVNQALDNIMPLTLQITV